jgi:2-C-methyl-D-erythritol 2,4-cyclodiphosphate synthase
MRVGIGYDIHVLKSGRKLVLGGVTIPHPTGLDGHSDADVVVHALMDAMLGAAGLDDIGTHFPPSDERFRAISSLLLLQRVDQMILARGLRLSNADIVVVAERPRLQPHISLMRETLCKALNLDRSQISLKATSNEGVGPEGREEAISAQAAVLLVDR